MPNEPHRLAPYQSVANALRTDILDGRLTPGDHLPSEHDLARTFGTTRMTVRKGIAQLRAEGLVVTSQGSRTVVRARPHVRLLSTGTNYRERRATGVTNFNAEAAAQGQRAVQRILAVLTIPAPLEVADRLNIEPDEEVLVRRRLFVVDDEPMQLCDGYYPMDIARDSLLMESRRIKGGAHAVIEGEPNRRRIVQFVEDLDVRMPTPDETERLVIPPGVPVARVLRTAYDAAGQPVEVLDSLVPCDRHVFRYVIDVS